MKNQKVDELEKKLAEATDSWKRALADYQNLEKRTREEKEAWVKLANSSLFLKLLPVLDSLDKLAKLDKFAGDEHLNLVLKQFRDVLTEQGIKKIEVMGKKFNPAEMECVETIEGEKEDEVLEEVRSGYYLYDKVLRVALVKVGKKSSLRGGTADEAIPA